MTRRNSLTLPCKGNSKQFYGEHYATLAKDTLTPQTVRTFVPDDESNSRQFDRLMRSNRGVL